MRPACFLLLLAFALLLPLRVPAAVQEPPPAAAAPPLDPQKALDGPVTLNLRDIPLRAALDLLFQGRGLNYAVDASVLNPPITISIQNQPFRTALRTLIRIASAALPGLTYTQDQDLFLIKMRTPPPTPVEEPPPVEEAPVMTELHWEKIPINYADVAAVTTLLGGTMTPGPVEAQSAAARPAGLAPRRIAARSQLAPEPVPAPAPVTPGAAGPAAPPTPGLSGLGGFGGGMMGGMGGLGGGGLGGASVQGGLVSPNLTILGQRGDNSLIVRGTDEDIAELKTLIRLIDLPLRQVRVRLSTGQLRAEGQAMNGSPLQLSDAAGTGRLAAAVVPRINGDATVSLEINGSLTMGGTTHPVATQVRVPAGESVHLFTLGEGSRTVRVWVKATLTPDPLEGTGHAP